MSPTVIAFLQFLEWASHYLWLAFAPDQNDLGNHVVYGGNVLDCIQIGHLQGPLHTAFGHGAVPNCLMSSP